MKIRTSSNRNYDLNPTVTQISDKILNRQSSYKPSTNIANRNSAINDTAAIYEKNTVAPDFCTYSPASVKAAASGSDTYGKYKTYLADMGFYNGAIDETYGDGFKNALVCFQKAYGSRGGYSQVVDVSGGIPISLKNWIQEVGAAFYTNLHNGRSTAAMKALGIESTDFEKKRNFARILTFLEKGMGCTTHQAAGVLGNIMQECRFNPLSENKLTGTIGILQWKDGRRQYLKNFAQTNGYSDEKNMGIQLAYFKYELSSTWGKDHLGKYAQNSHLVVAWKEFMADCKTDYDKAAVYFLNKIEGAQDQQKTERRTYAKLIYNAIKLKGE